jgi:hypothetical protein
MLTTHGLSNSLGPHIVRSTFLSPSSHKELVLLPFGQHPCLTAIQQEQADQGLVHNEFFWAWKMPRLRLFAHFEEACKDASICSLDYPLYHQGYLMHLFFDDFKSFVAKATLCPTSRIVLSFPVAIIYFILLSLFSFVISCRLYCPIVGWCLGWCTVSLLTLAFLYTKFSLKLKFW